MAAKSTESIIAEAVAAAVAAAMQGMTPAESKTEPVKTEPEKPATIGYYNVRTCERLKIAAKVNSTFTYEGKGGSVSNWRVVEVPKSGGVLAVRV